MDTTTPAPLTYGDTFTLPGAIDPGTGKPVLWQIRDTRALDKAGDPNEKRAHARPVRLNVKTGELVPFLRRDESIKVGRAERPGVEISFHYRRDFDRAADAYADVPTLRAWASSTAYDVSLTDTQSALIEKEVGALSFDFPPLTPADVVAKLIDRADYAGQSGGWEAAKAFPKSYTQSDETSALIRRALQEDETARDRILAALVESFTKQAESSLRALAGIGR